MKQKYAIKRPGAGIVSTHRTQTGACKALKRQQKGAEKQGGYSQDYMQILDAESGEYRDMKAGEYDPDLDIKLGLADDAD